MITLNEERNLARALQSVSFADEVIIIDSFSTDRTQEIAQSFGAKVYEHEFLGYGQQKNLALKYAQGEWVLWLDADEEVDAELAKNIQQAMTHDNLFDAYSLNRRTQFVGKWIYHGGWYPDYIVRLFKRGTGKFSEPEVHEELIFETQISIGRLPGHLNHYSFPTLESQVKTNLRYAQLGAKALVSKNSNPPSLGLVLMKPFGKFIECYFLKRGIQDGVHGLFIALNAAYSMFMKYSIAYLGKLKK